MAIMVQGKISQEIKTKKKQKNPYRNVVLRKGTKEGKGTAKLKNMLF